MLLNACRSLPRTYYFIGLWFVTAMVLGGLLVSAETSRTRLSDPDPARERPGYLMQPIPASKLTTDLPEPGKPTLVLFTRDIADQQLFHDLADQSDMATIGNVILVVQNGSNPTIANGLRAILADQSGQLAESYGLRSPQDGGYPVGYAVIDKDGQIRYRTLDPNFNHQASELKTVFRAVAR